MINKSILLATLTAGAMCGNSGLAAIGANQTTININEDIVEEEPEACTVMYVGKGVSEDGLALVCRSADSAPRGMNLNFKITKHNELANQTIYGQDGFEWKMPSTTYRYISTPRNVNVHKGLHWEVSGTNEMGVNVTATLSTYANNDVLGIDNYNKQGLGEDNLTQIIAATSATARQGIETVANILEEQGANDSNIILVQDKNEAWLMEIYTCHQYFAFKLPDNYACTIGNEFMVNSIDELITNYGLKEGDYITSKNLLDLVKDKSFVKFVDGKPHELRYLKLFDTYSRPLVYTNDEGKLVNTDNCHMRTWRGFNLFSKERESKHTYDMYIDEATAETRTKYEPFFEPYRKLGVSDVITYMRDRFDNIFNDPNNHNHDIFTALHKQKPLRWVGTDTAYQVHIMKVHPDLPAEYACEEWMCLSNANHAPFFPISNGIKTMNDYYTHVTEHYSYDDQSAICIFKQLNALADTDRTSYGLPIQNLFSRQEMVWQKQYADLIGQIKDLNVDVGSARDIITNYSLYIQDVALDTSKLLYDELNWHIMNLSQSAKPDDKLFRPLVDIEYYGWLYGWDYKRDGNIVTLTQGNETITIDLTYLHDKNGKITKGDVTKEVKVSVMNDTPYIDYQTAQEFISAGKQVAKIDINDFRSRNDLVWIVPVAIVVPVVVAAGILVPILIVSKKKKKQHVLVAN